MSRQWGSPLAGVLTSRWTGGWTSVLGEMADDPGGDQLGFDIVYGGGLAADGTTALPSRGTVTGRGSPIAAIMILVVGCLGARSRSP